MLGIDLGGANLQEADLRGADFYRAWLAGADFSGAQLEYAIFGEATLGGAKFINCDLREANLMKAHLPGADFTGANLTGTNFHGAFLERAILNGQSLLGQSIESANLKDAFLGGTDLSGANLRDTNLQGADLRGAILHQADLQGASLVKTQVEGADFTGALVHGISVWGMKGTPKRQEGLLITPKNESAVIVDDLAVAQLFYLLLDREKIKNVIDTVTRRGVLLLGRFGDGGLALLQALAGWLRKPENGGSLPLLFDFPRPESKTYTDTIRTLAGLARFVIVELSGPSVPQEITATVDLYEIPFVPILEQKREDWSMFRDFLVKERVLEPIRFTNHDHLLEILAEEAIVPAERLIEKRQQRLDKIFGRA